MYLNDLPLDYEGFHRLDSPPRDRPMSNNGRSRNGIAPWGNGEKFLGKIRPSNNFNEQPKNITQNTRLDQQQHVQQHNFIQSPQKSKKNRSNLGKLQKSFHNNKFNQIHLNMSKIQFKQFEQNSFNENQNQKLFKTNPKINVKDFSSLDNNFFIKSYFFPNNFKSSNRKGQAKSLDNKKRKQYYKIKEIQAPTFLAIKSVDLKQKFQLDQNDSDENQAYPLESEDFYKTYRTISVLSSRKKSHRKANKSMNENYKLKSSNDQFTAYHKTIESTKQSSKQISESLRQRYRMVIEQKARRDKLSESNEIIFTNSSFIKINLDEIHHSQETKITEEKQQVSTKTKKVSLSKQRQTRIDRLKKLRSKSDHENFMQSLTPYLQPKSILLCKNQKRQQNQTQQNPQDLTNNSQSFRNRIQGSKKQRNQLKISDQLFLEDKKSIKTINKSIILLKDNNEKSFRLK